MTLRTRLPLLALALSLPAPLLAQSAQDFSLPPNPAPSATPRAQGPVDEESGPVPTRPRVIRTETPTPAPTAAPTPAPTIAVDPRVVTPSAPAGQPATRLRPAEQRPAPARSVPPATVETPTFTPAAPETQPSLVPAPVDTAAPVPTASSAPAPTAAEPAANWWPFALGAALLVVLAGGFVFWRRRRENAPPPEIERPVVAAAAPRMAIPAAEAVTIRCEAEKLTRSAVFATLKYRLTLINRTDQPLNDVAIGLDLVSAHPNAPMEEQVATPGTALAVKHTLARIAPRQTIGVSGEVRLPLAEAQVILQGRHPLLVPLLRVRIDGAGEGALVKTFVVGQGQAGGGRVQPFPLDEPPRSYAPLAHRELA